MGFGHPVNVDQQPWTTLVGIQDLPQELLGRKRGAEMLLQGTPVLPRVYEQNFEGNVQSLWETRAGLTERGNHFFGKKKWERGIFPA